MRPPGRDRGSPALLQAAFRDLHGARLHGFVLLVTLGDRPLAAAVAARTLSDGARRASELRHPERAAAWLRAAALRSLGRRAGAGWRDRETQCQTLRGLGASDSVIDALAAMPLPQRAALVAACIERFEAIDIETIVGRSPPSTLRLLTDARRRYLAAAAGSPDRDGGVPRLPGPMAERIGAESARTLGAGTGTRR